MATFKSSRVPWVALALALLTDGGTARGQDITAIQNGYLTFTNGNAALYYRVEFRPNLTGPEAWDGAYKGLKNIQTNAPTVTVPVGVFYRIVGSTNPIYGVGGDALEGDILAGKTAHVNDAEIVGTMPDVGAQNITPGTADQTVSTGYHNGAGVVAGDADLASGNIRSGVAIFGVNGDSNVVDTASGNATEPDIQIGTKAWVDGAEVTGARYPAPTPQTGAGDILAYTELAGEDGHSSMRRGVAWPTPRFTDHGNGTVTDNLTGLTWLKDANAFGTRAWTNALADCAALNSGEHGLTDGSVAGDWRLPNIQELQSLVDYGQINPSLPSGHPFTGVVVTGYRSGTTWANVSTTWAWLVYLDSGTVSLGTKAGAFHVWPVRGGQ